MTAHIVNRTVWPKELQRKILKAEAKPHRVIAFSRYPEPGVTKTRMIPALGAERAARLQHSLTKLTSGLASDYRAVQPCDLEVRFVGGDPTLMRKAFGTEKRYRSRR